MTSTHVEETRRDALVERLFGATIGAFDLCGVYIGDRLGLYRALAEHGPASAPELAGAAGLHERYVLEWLEQQAGSAILDVVDAEDGEQRFVLPLGTPRRCSTRRASTTSVPSVGCSSPACDRSTRCSTRTGTVAASLMPTTAPTCTRARRRSRDRSSCGSSHRSGCRPYYGFSILHCLPVGMVGEGAVGTGTVMRPKTVEAYARHAGFEEVEVAPIENDFWRFYLLRP